MKKIFTKVALAALMVSAPLMAGNYSFETSSLFGIEGGYSTLDIYSTDKQGDVTKTFANLGLKIGAETENFRVFLDGHGYLIDSYRDAYSYGATLDYKFNFSQKADFFLGIGAGEVNMKPKNQAYSPMVEYYVGGEGGFDFHSSDNIDFQAGVRVIHIEKFNNILTGFVAIVFKWQMDD